MEQQLLLAEESTQPAQTPKPVQKRKRRARGTKKQASTQREPEAV